MTDCTDQLMIYPLADYRLEVKSQEVAVTGSPDVALFTDYFGNQVGVFSLVAPHAELRI